MTGSTRILFLLTVLTATGLVACDPQRSAKDEPAQEEATEPAAAEAQDHQPDPCRVELVYTTYRFLVADDVQPEDDETEMVTLPPITVDEMVHPEEFLELSYCASRDDCDRDRTWQDDPIAPLPLNREEALALSGSTEVSQGVQVDLGDAATIHYAFTDEGRPVSATFERSADRSAYRFLYHYDCPTAEFNDEAESYYQRAADLYQRDICQVAVGFSRVGLANVTHDRLTQATGASSSDRSSIRNCRRSKNNGRARETPTTTMATKGAQRCRTPILLPSTTTKRRTAAADTTRSSQAKVAIGLADAS